MQNRYRKVIVIASVLATVGAGASWAGPPNPTASDANGNTAGGSFALVDSSPDSLHNTAFGKGALSGDNFGSDNTAIGEHTLVRNTTGSFNTATGAAALANNSEGSFNTATGVSVLTASATGSANTATGYRAHLSNGSGSFNTATGVSALETNSTGSANTASGFQALFTNSGGNNNTAIGAEALYSNTIGRNNTVSGLSALKTNTTGSDNTTSGTFALAANTLGVANTADGNDALTSNTTGNTNTAFGVSALKSNTTGGGNIALGHRAGFNLTTGSGNITIGHEGVAGDSSTIRIGTSQTRTFLAGVHGKTVGGGSAVIINSSGQLGTVVSSARYKQDIQNMGQQSAKLRELRPVTFHYTAEPQGAKQYGLIAEEVEKVYPELVVYGEEGQIESVQYHQLISMLLNEVQQQQSQMEVRAQQLMHQSQELAELKARNMRSKAAIVQVEALTARLAQLEAGQATRLAQR